MNITLSFELENIDWPKIAEIFEKAPSEPANRKNCPAQQQTVNWSALPRTETNS